MHLHATLRFLAGGMTLALIALASEPAWAGRIHPRLESELAALPTGGELRVIVELATQADATAAAAATGRATRRVRTKAVVDALRDVANQRQGPVRALLAREQALGNVRRVVPLWIFNGLAVTANEAVIRRLAARPDVWEIRPDTVIPPPPLIQPMATPGPSASGSLWNIEQIRAPEVWALDPAYNGEG